MKSHYVNGSSVKKRIGLPVTMSKCCKVYAIYISKASMSHVQCTSTKSRLLPAAAQDHIYHKYSLKCQKSQKWSSMTCFKACHQDMLDITTCNNTWGKTSQDVACQTSPIASTVYLYFPSFSQKAKGNVATSAERHSLLLDIQ